MNIKKTLIILIWFIPTAILLSQSQILPLSYDLNIRLSKSLYHIGNNVHSSIQPYELKDITTDTTIEAIVFSGRDAESVHDNWFESKLYDEHF